MIEIQKYPRTPHLESSRLQPGDDDVAQVAYASLQAQWIVVEEKFDGGQGGLRFDGAGERLLQSRGHFLAGGPGEFQFDEFKQWAAVHNDALLDRLEDRYGVYGEWMRIKHTMFYDHLPHLWLEFDVLDFERSQRLGRPFFLSTAARRELLEGLPVVPVRVLYEGPAPKRLRDLLEMVGPSAGKSPEWRQALVQAAEMADSDPARIEAETFMTDLMEGLYVKVEDGDETVGRLKWVHPRFVQTITDSGSHWMTRPRVQNMTRPGVDIYAPELTPAMSWDDGPGAVAAPRTGTGP